MKSELLLKGANKAVLSVCQCNAAWIGLQNGF